MGIVVRDRTNETDYGTNSDVILKLPQNDVDIDVVLPNGRSVVLQWRMEGASLDLILPEPKLMVHTWEGDDLEPSKGHADSDHIRYCGQLCLDFGDEYTQIAEQ